VNLECLEDKALAEAFKRIVAVLSEKRKHTQYLEFEAGEVGVKPYIISKLVYDCGLLVLAYHSNKYKFYKLTISLDEAINLINMVGSSPPVEVGFGDVDEVKRYLDLVVGLEDEKRLVLDALRAPDPIHVLFIGPPGVGKTLLLEAVSKARGAVMFTAGSATKAGIRDLILSYRPRVLVIDELDKISDPKDLSVLLSLMWEGKVYVTMKTMRVSEEMRVKVFAAANRIYSLPQELLDRFIKIPIPDYDDRQRREVVAGALTKIEGLPEDLAGFLAEEGVSSGLGVREIIQIARLCKTHEDPYRCGSKYIAYISDKKKHVPSYWR